MEAWHITQWDKYERADTRKTNNMTWYAKQTKLVGRGIGATLKLPWPKNAQLLGLWAMIETLASMSEVEHRGWLVRDYEPMDAAMMSDLIPSFPPEAFQEALDHFSRADVRWLERWTFSASRPLPGFSPGQSPAVLPVAGGSPGQSPAVLPVNPDAARITGGNSGTERQTDRQTDRHSLKDTHTIAPGAPSEVEVKTWATNVGVPPDFAALKIAQAVERKDFVKKAWSEGWQSKVQRFWAEDGAAWVAKNQKKRRAPGAKPDGWQAGDAAQWWSDPLAEVRATLSGATLLKDEKTAARLKEVIAAREKGKA